MHVKRREELVGVVFIHMYIAALVSYGWVQCEPILRANGPATLWMLKYVTQPVGACAVASFWLCTCCDPGRVRSLRRRGPDATACAVCGELRPPRSHHCRTCGECVAGYDHHCAVLGVCIAQGNQRYFIWLLGTGAVASLQVLWAAWLCLSWEMRGERGADVAPWREAVRLATRYLVPIGATLVIGTVTAGFCAIQAWLRAIGVASSTMCRKGGLGACVRTLLPEQLLGALQVRTP